MKKLPYIILIIIALGFAIYFGICKNMSDKISPETLASIKSGSSMPIEICKYDGKSVIKSDMRPVDGPLKIYNSKGAEIGYVTSGFGSPVQSTIDESKITDCKPAE